MFHDILVAVDGSAGAEAALTRAIQLAESEHSRLTLFTATAQPPRFAYWGLAAPGLLSFFERADREAEEIARRGRQRVPNQVNVTSVVTCERVKPALVRHIANSSYDLVVMGSRDRSAALGSVSHYVLHHTTAPVLIVHPKSTQQRDAVDCDPTPDAPTILQPMSRIETA